MERSQQIGIAEGLEQAFYSTLRDQSWADRVIFIGSDEDDRKLPAAALQFQLQLGAGHTWHSDVQDQAFAPVNGIRREKLFGRGEPLGRKTQLAQQIRQRLANGLVVINYRYQWALKNHELLMRC